jgi:hypothetical protein
VSVSSTGEQANGGSGGAEISEDGRFVVFTSAASNLVAGDTNGASDVFVRDLVAGTTERVSVSDWTGEQATAWGRQQPRGCDQRGHFVVTDAFWSNPLTGDVVPYTQNNVVSAALGVPGEFSTEIDTVTGENIYRTASGTGKWVLHSTGRQVFFSPFGNFTAIISSTPNNPSTEAALGDTTVFDQVCAALAA